jgi:class 3 adenylate cyclase
MRASGRFAPAQNVADGSGQESARSEHRLHGLRLVQTGDGAGSGASRLAVILVADAVDYSRQMEADEAGTYARLSTIFRSVVGQGVARHGGKVVKDTGDGFLAVFWSATSAVWFAVEFQNALRARNARRARERRLEFRVGINLGDVIVAPDDVFGHNVNVAARLEASAEPGGVLVSHGVFVAVRDRRLSFEDAGEVQLGNISEAVRAFRARLATPRRWRRPSAVASVAAMDG